MTNYIEELYLLYLKALGYSFRVSNTLLVLITPLRELKVLLLGVTVTSYPFLTVWFTKVPMCTYVTQVYYFCNTWMQWWNQGYSYLVSLKWHHYLCQVSKILFSKKTKACRIDGTLFLWFKNYLSGRMQWMVLNGWSSQWVNITSGVPQGAISRINDTWYKVQYKWSLMTSSCIKSS